MPVLLALVESTFGLFVSPFLALAVAAVCRPVLILAGWVSTLVVAS